MNIDKQAGRQIDRQTYDDIWIDRSIDSRQ